MDVERTISRWADMPSDDSSVEEQTEPVTPPSKSEKPENGTHRANEQLLTQIGNSPLPILFRFKNLSFKLSTPELLLKQLRLSTEDSAKISVTIGKVENKPSGQATAIVPTCELALTIAELHDREICGRRLFISLDNFPHKNAQRYTHGPRRALRQPKIRQSYATHQQGSFKRELTKNSAPKSCPFGDAKPVNTRAKDLEFEIKGKASEDCEEAKEHVRVDNRQPQPKAWSNYKETVNALSSGGKRGPQNN